MVALTLVVLFVLFLASFASAATLWFWYREERQLRQSLEVACYDLQGDELLLNRQVCTLADRLTETSERLAEVEAAYDELQATAMDAVVAHESLRELDEDRGSWDHPNDCRCYECSPIRQDGLTDEEFGWSRSCPDQCGCDACWDEAVVRGGRKANLGGERWVLPSFEETRAKYPEEK
jgi:hypothetical protein